MILQAKNMAKSFGRKQILRDVSFEMEPCVLYGIVGENGSGKSTLLKIIVGEWAADSGHVTINGKLGYCPQNTLLFPYLTIEEHFRYFGAAYGIDREALPARCAALLEHFQFQQYSREKVGTLSGGTQQKLNLSLALLHQPSLLVLDEPYNGFDWDTYLKFWDYTNHLRSNGCAILIVTHMLSERERFDRIFTLQNGCLV